MDSPSDTNSGPFLQDVPTSVDEALNRVYEELAHVPQTATYSRNVPQVQSNCRCPACGIDMKIAGWYDKSQSTLNGVSQCQHECIKCGKQVTPVKIS